MTDKMAIRTFPTAHKLKAIKRAEEAPHVTQPVRFPRSAIEIVREVNLQ